jgi:hypothetical protein
MSEGEPGQQAYGLGRILALSDGVFAFSLTLLVVSLSVPTANSDSTLATQLLDQGPTYFSYLISFVAVASIWYGHHESFKYIRRYDGRLIALNFGSLLVIAFLPFPTAVLGHNQQEPLAAILYALTIGPWAALLCFLCRFPLRCGDRLQPRSSGLYSWSRSSQSCVEGGRPNAGVDLPPQIARMRLLRGLCSTSARPSASRTGGM